MYWFNAILLMVQNNQMDLCHAHLLKSSKSFLKSRKKYFHVYLISNNFILGRIQRWALVIIIYQYTISFCPKKSHSNPDALNQLLL